MSTRDQAWQAGFLLLSAEFEHSVYWVRKAG